MLMDEIDTYWKEAQWEVKSPEVANEKVEMELQPCKSQVVPELDITMDLVKKIGSKSS